MSASLWLDNLAAYSLQLSLLVIAGSILPAMFRLLDPRVRLVYWQVLLAVCLALPLAQPWNQAATSPTATVSIQAVTLAVAPAASRRFPWTEAVLFILGAGVAARSTWLALGFLRLRRYRRKAEPLDPLPEAVASMQARTGIAPAMYLSADVRGPVTFGLRRPVVLFPARFPEMEPAGQEAIVCHELLHVRRRDWLFTVFEEVIRAGLWFHPGIWWLLGQVQLSREQAVDREVVKLTGSRDLYLSALLEMARAAPPLDLAPAPLFLRKRNLRQRVALLVKEVSMSARRLTVSLAAIAGLLVVTGWFATRSFPLRAAQVATEAVKAESLSVRVEEGDSNLLHRVPIEYPSEAVAKRISGRVILEVQVNERGVVTDARVLSGPQELRRAALQSVLQWHYSPETTTPGLKQVTVNFGLREVNRMPLMGKTPPPKVAESRDLGVLKAIDVIGLPADAREKLLSRLPVRVGEPVTSEVLSRVRETVREADEHLAIAYVPAPDGVTLLISLGDQGRRVALERRIAQELEMKRALEGSASSASAPEESAPKRIRVGGNVQANNLIESKRPEYPPLAKQARIQGVVKLNVTIGEDGAVRHIEVVSGHPLLVPPSIEAVKTWVYRPTLLNGKPVEVITEVDVNFTLAD